MTKMPLTIPAAWFVAMVIVFLAGCAGDPSRISCVSPDDRPGGPVTCLARTRPTTQSPKSISTPPTSVARAGERHPLTTEPPHTDPSAAPIVVCPDPPQIDLGEIETFGVQSGTLCLQNTDVIAHTVKSIRSSCGCMTVRCEPGTVVQPGEWVAVPIQLSGGPTPGPVLHKVLTVDVEGQRLCTVPVKATAVCRIAAEPTVLDPENNKDGRFTLRALDGEPFRILSMYPPIIDVLPAGPAAVHQLTLDWDAFRKWGLVRRLTFWTDHPRCQQTIVIVNIPMEERPIPSFPDTGVRSRTMAVQMVPHRER